MERSDRREKTGRYEQILGILAKSIRKVIREETDSP